MIGEQIGEYRITARLGAGGMGVVYRGEHVLLGRPAAIKVLHGNLSADHEIVQRFFNEAKAASAIRHPGIVQVYTFGYHHDGTAYIAMEHLEGETLERRVCTYGKLPYTQALRIVAQVASALGAAHAQGIVHRDLKPDNIFLIADPDVPGGERIQLLDFGIAKLAGDTTARGYDTRTGAVFGTPAFMSPEQCRGASQVDHRSDIYSLGCILYRAVCRRVPFVGELSGDVIASHIRDSPPAPRAIDPAIPVELEAVILRMLAKDPGDRYQTAADVRADVEALVARLRDQPPAEPSARLGGGAPGDAALADTHAPPAGPATTLGASAGVITGASAGGHRRGRALAIGAAIAAVAGAAAITAYLATRDQPARDNGKTAAATSTAPGTAASRTPPRDEPAARRASAAPDGGATPAAAGPRRAPTADACARALAAASARIADSPTAESMAYFYLAAYADGGDRARELDQVCLGEYDVELADCFTGAADAAAVASCGDEFVRRQCERGDPDACASAAAIAADNNDVERALTLATESCERGAGEGCSVVGSLAYFGRGMAVDRASAFRSFSRAHTLGDPRGGASAAEMLDHGIGVAADPARAKKLFEEACAIDPRGDACIWVAEQMLDSGSRRASGLARLEPLCKEGRARACVLIAEHGPRTGAAAMFVRAHELYELARPVSPRSETRLGELCRDGKGRAADPARAAELFDSACRRNEPLACEQLAALLVSGSVPIDLRRSGEAADVACQAGRRDACARAGCLRLFAEGRSEDKAWNKQVAACRTTGVLGPDPTERARRRVRKSIRPATRPQGNGPDNIDL